MDEFTNFTAALLVLMFGDPDHGIGFLLLAVGGGAGRRRITRVNVSRPGRRLNGRTWRYGRAPRCDIAGSSREMRRSADHRPLFNSSSSLERPGERWSDAHQGWRPPRPTTCRILQASRPPAADAVLAHAGVDPFADLLAFKLCELRQDAEHQLAGWRLQVHPQRGYDDAHPARMQFLGCLERRQRVAAQPAYLPDISVSPACSRATSAANLGLCLAAPEICSSTRLSFGTRASTCSAVVWSSVDTRA
jgi:hypothetical protein